MEPAPVRRRFWPWLLVGVGYILSPLSWWNDVFVNIPLAWLFASLVGLISHGLFAPALVVGYWLTNLAGVVLFQQGTAQLVAGRAARPRLRVQLLVAAAYTALIVVLLAFGLLRPFWRMRP